MCGMPAQLAEIFAAARPEVVFHLAAQIDVRHSVEDPADDATRTCSGRSGCSRRPAVAGARRVVNTSTGGGLYGDADVMPTPEDYPIRPLAPYGQGKYAAEGYCELYTRLHGLSTVSLRYGNVYGPRQDVHGEAGVVAIFCGALSTGAGRPCSETDGRRAIGSTSATWSARTCSRPNPSSPVRSISVRGRETSVLELLEALNERQRPRPAR